MKTLKKPSRSEAGFRRLLVTQPRRLAAVALARRVAQERMERTSRCTRGFEGAAPRDSVVELRVVI